MAWILWTLAAAVFISRTTLTNGDMFGSSTSSFSSSGGGMSSSSSSSSTSDGISISRISQSQTGGTVTLQCFAPRDRGVVWYKLVGGQRQEIARGGQLTISEPRYHVSVNGNAYLLQIKPTRATDSGMFLCVAGSGVNAGINQFELSIGSGNNGGADRTAATAAAAAAGTLMLFL